ncbi:polymer-forming cytoskeletal protein [Candidatus Uhrbacteria bacterium]|jgi:cytoskeletal protein CcmA (bactofilin family)|nr:polymer-forming cytoskeletal protein [Candidatus Uhrbacteria bacterium]
MAKGNGGDTIIAEGVKVEGDFTSNGNVTIEGHVSGNVAAGGDIFIGENAVIDADVTAKNAVVAGRVKGNVRIDEKIELTASSNLEGDLETRVMIVAPGAQINGRIVMPDGKKGAVSVEEEIED